MHRYTFNFLFELANKIRYFFKLI